MNIDIEGFVKNTCADINLMEKNQLIYFLNGFSYKLLADITVYYKDETGIIERMDSHNSSTTSKFSPNNFCKLFRETNIMHEASCLQCDESVAQKYYKGLWSTPMIYCCHMKIWDMAYPLIVNGRLIGVLFAGQFIVDDDMAVLSERLTDEFGNEFYKESCPLSGSQVSNIMESIDSIVVAGHNSLKDMLTKDSQSYKGMLNENGEALISYDILVSHYRDFKEFGAILTTLFSKLHRLTVMNAQMDLLNEMSSKLSKNTTSTDIWWYTVDEVISSFRRAANLENFEIYYRDKSYFIQKVGAEGLVSIDKAKRIPLDMAVGIPVDELVPLHQISEYEELLTEFNFDRNALLYRSEVTDFENQNISTLLLVSSPVSKSNNINFTRMFCEMIAVRTNISGIFNQMILERADYTKSVRRVTHYTKTMLHNALSNIRQLRRSKQVNRSHLDNIEESIKLAKLEMAELDMKSIRYRIPQDILMVIDEVVNFMTSWANERECIIEYQKPSRPVMVNINKDEIKIAITNLLENAIKYSYAKHTVRVSIYVPDNSSILIKFINFGIGIPGDRINEIRKEGHRAEVKDVERTNVMRAGSGLGLPIAIDFIESHSGSLHIRSVPADNFEKNPYHRYITTVTVTLPLNIERRKIYE